MNRSLLLMALFAFTVSWKWDVYNPDTRVIETKSERKEFKTKREAKRYAHDVNMTGGIYDLKVRETRKGRSPL